MTQTAALSLTPLRLAATGGILWNAFGVFQYLTSVTTDVAGKVAMGMTPAQAELYDSLPMWMDAVFAIGTWGGLIGSLLLLRKRLAVPVFAVSLVAYLALAFGDWLYGVFALFGTTQVIVISFVVAIAVALFVAARRWAARGLLS